MANYKGHTLAGAVFGGLYALALIFLPVGNYADAAGLVNNWQAFSAIVVVSVLFGLFPDVDTNSKAQDLFFGLAFIIDIILILLGKIEAAAYLGLIAMLPIIGHHRGWTHKKWACLAVPLPLLVVPYLYDQSVLAYAIILYGAGVAGYFSHLFFDGLIWDKFRFKN